MNNYRQKVIPKNAKKVFTGKIFNVFQWQQKLYNGKTKTFEMLERPDTILVIPTTPDKKIIMQIQEQPTKKTFLSLPGGRVDQGETPKSASLRELEEETGYTSSNLKLFERKQLTSKIDWFLYIFIAKNCKKKGKMKLDGGEKIKLKFVTLEQLLELANKQEFEEGALMYELIRAYHDKNYREKLKKLLFD